MPTHNPRINITFEKETAALLSDLAASEDKPIARLAKELILDALSRREDLALSAIAELKDKEGVETISHDDAWK